MLDSGAEGPGFKSQVTVFRQTGHTHRACLPSSKIGSSPVKGCEGNCGPGGK